METIFLSQDLWSIVDEGYEERSREDNSSSSDEGDVTVIEEQEKAVKENVMKNAMALRIL